jgi:hypothetical protein
VSTGKSAEVPEEEEEEGYISIEQMTTMIDHYQSPSPFSSKDDSRTKVPHHSASVWHESRGSTPRACVRVHH